MVFMNMKICIQCNKEKDELQFNINGRNGYRNLRCKICLASNRQAKVATEPDTIVKPSSELTHKTCKVCEKNRLIKYFWKNSQYKDGYDARCKICRIEGRKQPKKNISKKTTPKHLQNVDQIIKLTFLRKEDFMSMWEFLESMGYDIHNKEKSVHEQFIDKWNGLTNSNMTYTTKVRATVNMYLPNGDLNPEYIKYKKNSK